MDLILKKCNLSIFLFEDMLCRNYDFNMCSEIVIDFLKKLLFEINPQLNIIIPCNITGDYKIIKYQQNINNRIDKNNFWYISFDNEKLFYENYKNFSYQICRIKNNRPCFSVIMFPKNNITYLSRKGLGSIRQFKDSCPKKIFKTYKNEHIIIDENIHLINRITQ